jgi:hypothetical protein
MPGLFAFIRGIVATKPVPMYVSDWVAIPCHTADSLDAHDAMGDKFSIPVPVSGTIQSASLLDRDDEGTQIDVVLLDGPFVSALGDAAFSLADSDGMKEIYQLNFAILSDNVNNYFSSIENIGKGYRVPPDFPGSKMGKIYAQAITRATPTIAAGSEPLLRLEIRPDEPV